MWQGTVELLSIAPIKSKPVHVVDEVRAVAGKGLVGDYHHENFTNKPETHRADREITLIEVESLEALKRDYDIELEKHESRRNIVTRGVPLNHLVGVEFRVGEARLRGIRLCEPCFHIEDLTQKGVEDALVHRGGLRAEIVQEGTIRVGDTVQP